MVDIERPLHTKENERTIVYHGTGMRGRTPNLMDIASQIRKQRFTRLELALFNLTHRGELCMGQSVPVSGPSLGSPTPSRFQSASRACA